MAKNVSPTAVAEINVSFLLNNFGIPVTVWGMFSDLCCDIFGCNKFRETEEKNRQNEKKMNGKSDRCDCVQTGEQLYNKI